MIKNKNRRAKIVILSRTLEVTLSVIPQNFLNTFKV